MLMVLALLALQDAAKPADAQPQPQRWSILNDPCASARSKDEIVVCGQGGLPDPRLPLPEERGPPDRAIASNPDARGIDAMGLVAAPCATRSEGCAVGINLFGMGTALIRGVGKLVDPNSCCENPGDGTNPFALIGDVASGVGRAFRKKPDKSNRVAIPLDDLPPSAPEREAGTTTYLPLP
jgi:hypothetical protein